MALVDYREDTEGSVDTWEILDQQRADDAGNFIVPPEARRITAIKLYAALDKGADAIVRLATAFDFSGPAIRMPNKPFRFLGPAGGTANTGASEQSLHFSPPAIYYPDWPVTPNASFVVQAQFFGEDAGDVSFGCVVIYDGPSKGQQIVAAQVREADLADATEALVTLNGNLDGGTENFTVPPDVRMIGDVAYVVGLDVAGDTRIANQFEIDGDGLDVPIKPQRWCGYFGTNRLDSEGGETWYWPPEMLGAGFAVKGVNQPIRARAGMIEDDYGAGTAAVGLLFG